MKNNIKLLKYGMFLFFLGSISCNDNDSIIDTKPVAAFSVNETDVIEGNATVFTDLSFDQNGSIASWNWDFGDGNSSTEQSPVHTYDTGAYTVVLTVTDNTGNANTNEFSKTINVVEPSTATIEPTKVWVFNLPAKLEASSPAVGDDGTVYIGCSAKNGLPNVFAVKNGIKVWSYATGDIVRSTPAIAANGNIFIGSYDNNLYGFTPTGNLAMQFDMGNNAKYSGPIFATDGTIYIGSQTDELIAVNPNGTEKWRFDTDGDVNSTPAIGADGTIYVGSTGDDFFAFNPDGTVKWRKEYGKWAATVTALGEDGTVYFAGEGNNLNPTSGGVLIAYNPTDGTERWRTNLKSKVNHGGPSVAPDGTIYLGGHDKELVAYNANDGTIKWTYPTNGAIQGVPAIDNDGNIYVTDTSGFLYIVDAMGNKKWKATQLGSKIWSSPTIGPDGTIYVAADQSDGTGKLFALKTKATGLAKGGWPMRSKNAKHTGH